MHGAGYGAEGVGVSAWWGRLRAGIEEPGEGVDMGRVTNVRAYMRNGRPVRAHTRGVPGRTSGAGVVALVAPSWAGSELQGYRAGSDDCGADARLWVVQPGTSGMYRLTSACFGDGWKAEIVRKCRSYSASLPPGRCAVWDRDGIMSTGGAQGGLRVVVLTDACLTRAALPDFHVGPLHRDCVVAAP